MTSELLNSIHLVTLEHTDLPPVFPVYFSRGPYNTSFLCGDGSGRREEWHKCSINLFCREAGHTKHVTTKVLVCFSGSPLTLGKNVQVNLVLWKDFPPKLWLKIVTAPSFPTRRAASGLTHRFCQRSARRSLYAFSVLSCFYVSVTYTAARGWAATRDNMS